MMSANENIHVPESDTTRQKGRRWLSRAVAVVYGLVMFEVAIMVSPFAFYFYAAYGPTLKWLNHSAATAWLTGFLLPHAVFTTSPVLEFLRWDLGRYFFGLGLLAFFVQAAQIYGSKLLGRKLVNSGIYRYIRHPQYLSLGLSAFGLFTMWPRMIIFLFFVGMLFAYYFLARVEERRMLAIDPSYADYMGHTGMFLPGNPGGRLYRLLFGNLGERKFARPLALTSLLVLVLLAVFGLRAYTVRHIARTAVLPNVEVVSVYPKTAVAMQELFSLALSDPSVQEALQREGNATFVAHLLPHDYGMIGMFADVGTGHMAPGNVHLSRFKYLCAWLLPFLDSHVRTGLMGSDGQEYRVVFSRVDGPHGQPVPAAQLFNLSAKMTPVYVVDVSAATHQVSRTIDPPHRSFWGDVKMPMF
ncbi:MAG TPA: isoprenylcysteine carboxylmethyltransferase family protein [Terriglobales bacterium]|nr:isoprenylcysteine carboxylmethyltransferase family protein [Terriglobales bacterium]